MTADPPLVFSAPEYEYLAPAFCEAGPFERGGIEVRAFPDGERYLRLLNNVMGRDVVLLGGTISDATTLTLYDLACAIAKYGALRLTLVIPFFGYSTMERAVRPGEVVVAKTRARLLSSVPPSRYGNSAILLDLHSEGIPHYFEGSITTRHVYGKRLILDAVRCLGASDAVLGSTDAGRAKWVESLANDLGTEAAFVYKRRLSGDTTEVKATLGNVSGRHVIIYDDMIRSGSSLIGAAEAYRAGGATRVSALTTHGLFVGDSFARLKATGLFDHIIATDSHPRARELQAEGLEVLPVAPLLASAFFDQQRGAAYDDA